MACIRSLHFRHKCTIARNKLGFIIEVILGLYWCYTGIMEKRVETTVVAFASGFLELPGRPHCHVLDIGCSASGPDVDSMLGNSKPHGDRCSRHPGSHQQEQPQQQQPQPPLQYLHLHHQEHHHHIVIGMLYSSSSASHDHRHGQHHCHDISSTVNIMNVIPS